MRLHWGIAGPVRKALEEKFAQRGALATKVNRTRTSGLPSGGPRIWHASLGPQSPKQLRHEELDDVVFGHIHGADPMHFLSKRAVTMGGVDERGDVGAPLLRQEHQVQPIEGAQPNVGDERTRRVSLEVLPRRRKISECSHLYPMLLKQLAHASQRSVVVVDEYGRPIRHEHSVRNRPAETEPAGQAREAASQALQYRIRTGL